MPILGLFMKADALFVAKNQGQLTIYQYFAKSIYLLDDQYSFVHNYDICNFVLGWSLSWSCMTILSVQTSRFNLFQLTVFNYHLCKYFIQPLDLILSTIDHQLSLLSFVLYLCHLLSYMFYVSSFIFFILYPISESTLSLKQC